MKTKELKRNKGITLIALVITIIVLLILAGITIATLTGENGILTKATEAGRQTEIEGIREEAEMAKQGVLSGDLATGKETTREDVINAIVDEMGGTATGNLITTEDGKYEIMVKEDNTIEVVEKGQGYIDAEYKEAAPESDFRWTTLEDGTVRIYEYLGTETSLNIPDTIDGKVVTVLKSDSRYVSSSGSGEGGKIATQVTLNSIKIPDTVTEIGRGAFLENNLEKIEFPSNLTTIGASAFGKNKLKKVEMPNTVTTVGESAFKGNVIEDLKLSSGLKEIKASTFSNNKLKSIKIPEGVTHLENYSFSDNEATNIEIAKTVTTIDQGVFLRNNLEDFIYARTSTGEEDKTFIKCYAGKNAGNLKIPDGVELVESNACFDVGITSLEIPASVRRIGGFAFGGDDLEKITIYAQPEMVMQLAISADNIECIEFKADTFYSGSGIIFATGSINKIIVPYSEDHSVLEYYKGLQSNGTILAGKSIGEIIETE